MKQFKISFFLTLLMSMAGLQAFAAWDTSTKIEVDGLYYYLDNVYNHAQVTSKPSGKYTGNITIPKTFTYNTTYYSVTSIGARAFSSCSSLESITIPNSVTSIGEYAFNYCSTLESITIPNSVTSIGNNAFSSCSSLESITIPSNVTSIEASVFMECIGLTSVTIPNSVTRIGQTAFSSCSSLESITIPSNVTSIGNYAFAGCSSLESITIPNSVTSIGPSAFGFCSGLSSISVEAGNTTYDSRDDCNAIIETTSNYLMIGCKNTVIPNSVTNIGSAFIGCTDLTSITIPTSVTRIGDDAFSGCI